MGEEIEIKLTAKTDDFKESLIEAEKVARDTGKKLDPLLKKELELKVDDVEQKIKQAKALLKTLDPETKEARELRLDINQYKRTLSEAKRNLNNYINTGETGTSRLQAKFNQVTDEIKNSRDELVKLGKSTKNLDKIEAAIQSVNADFRDGKIDIKKYTDEIQNLQAELNSAGGSFDGISKSIGNFSGVLIGAVGAGLTADLFLDVDAGVNKLIASTGAAGKEADDLKKSFGDLAKAGFSNFDENVEVLAKVKKELGLVGDEATRVSTQYLSLAQTFDKDVNEVIRGSVGLMRNFGITSNEANDLITASLQNSGDLYDDILDTLNEYSTQFSKAGYSAEEFANVLVKGSQDGAFMIDKIGDAIKEATVSLLDNSATTRKAFSQMGLDYDGFLKQLNSGQITVKDGIDLVNTEIQKLDQGLRDEVGTAIFKTKWEDLSESVIAGLSDSRNALGEFEGAADLTSEQLQKGLTFQLNKLKGIFTDLAVQVMPVVLGAVNVIRTAWDALTTTIANFGIGVQQALTLAGGVLTDFPNVVVGVGKAISKTFGFAVENIGIAFGNLPALARRGLNSLLEKVSDTVNKAIGILNKLPKVDIEPVSFQGIDGGTIQEFKSFNGVVKDIKNDMNKWTASTKKAYAISKELGKAQDDNVRKTKENIKGIWSEGISANAAAQAQITKDRQEENKKRLDELKKDLAKEAQAEKDAKEKGAKAGSDARKKAIEEEYKTLKGEAKKAYNDIDKSLAESKKAKDAYIKSLEKNSEAFEDFKKSAVDDIREIESELKKLANQRSEIIGDSEAEKKEFLVERIVEIDESLKDESISSDDREALSSEREEAKKALEELVKLQLKQEGSKLNELSYLQDEVSKLIEAQKNYEALSETKKKLLEIEEERAEKLKEIAEQEAALNEKKAIAETITSGEGTLSFEKDEQGEVLRAYIETEKEGLVEITDEANIQYALQLEAKQNQLETERLELEAQIQHEKDQYGSLLKEKIKLERQWNSFFKESINEQMVHADALIAKMNALAAAKANAGYKGDFYFTGATEEKEKAQNSQTNVETKITISDATDKGVEIETTDEIVKNINQ